MVEAVVEIFLKKGVADPEGDATLKALRLLGFSKVASVGSAKLFRISVDETGEAEARRAVEEMCRKLLANPVIHDYRIRIVS